METAAEIWKNSNPAGQPFAITNWKGQDDALREFQIKEDPDGYDVVYGCGDNANTTPGSCIARDAVVFIVAANSSIQVNPDDNSHAFYIGKIATGDYAACTACIAAMYNNGCGYCNTSVICYQCYDLSAQHTSWSVPFSGLRFCSGTRYWVMSNILCLSATKYDGGQQNAITAYSDADMVNKVAADPYGIGYCSAAFADTNRVAILGITTNNKLKINAHTRPNTQDGQWSTCIQLYPACIPNKRWILPEQPEKSWPFIRNLYLKTNWSSLPAATFTNQLCGLTTNKGKGGAGPTIADLLLTGPLFRCSFYHR
jgi:hypothetical protein